MYFRSANIVLNTDTWYWYRYQCTPDKSFLKKSVEKVLQYACKSTGAAATSSWSGGCCSWSGWSVTLFTGGSCPCQSKSPLSARRDSCSFTLKAQQFMWLHMLALHRSRRITTTIHWVHWVHWDTEFSLCEQSVVKGDVDLRSLSRWRNLLLLDHF